MFLEGLVWRKMEDGLDGVTGLAWEFELPPPPKASSVLKNEQALSLFSTHTQ